MPRLPDELLVRLSSFVSHVPLSTRLVSDFVLLVLLLVCFTSCTLSAPGALSPSARAAKAEDNFVVDPHPLISTPTESPTSSASAEDSSNDGLLVRCYGRWGCFTIEKPFLSRYRPINLFPLAPEILSVRFLLKTRRNPDLSQKLRPWINSTFAQSEFDASKPIVFIVHGYLEHGYSPWIKHMATELLTKADLNVIALDWVIGATPPYTQAVANARMVGAILADFIEYLQDIYGCSPTNMHIIGHSLGAHIAGYAGQKISKLGRITGLDPAEPYFQYTDPLVRLDPTDALFVDVIHTDGSSIITGGWGMIQNCGHVDFYPNGGKRQPGCDVSKVIVSLDKEPNLIHGIRRFLGCNHIRAYEFFTESINTECPFKAYVCPSYEDFSAGHCPQGCGPTGSLCARLGYSAAEWKGFLGPQPVAMFLQTADKQPFCQYHYHIQLHCSTTLQARNHGEEKGRLFVRLTGTKGQSATLEASKENINFGAGQMFSFLISSHDLGKLLRMEVEWRPVSSLLNPLTWRLFDAPRLFIKYFEVVTLENGIRTRFCGDDEPVKPQKIKTLFSDKHCHQ